MLYALAIPGPIEDVEEVRVLEWHGAIGHAFEPGDLIVEFETHKAVVEIRAGQHGWLRSILCQEGEWQMVGQLVAVLSDTANEPLVPTNESGLVPLKANFEIV